MNRRRELVFGLGVATLAWAGAAFDQSKKPPILIGLLSAGLVASYARPGGMITALTMPPEIMVQATRLIE
jgi:hypothetical protein